MSDLGMNLVDRLRGIYAVALADGSGLLNGKDTHAGTFKPLAPIQGEAADEIESLRAAGRGREKRIGMLEERLAELFGWCEELNMDTGIEMPEHIFGWFDDDGQAR